ncbi:twin-arginine translocase TatA/TatE family subunit [Zhaonella formicivorans]|jgi:sec-independent protein translocase protein TatA|uniref:twin-arginine translocase TatA/TatE family subunit n=1 Tax=Zhaonella formicivorans TaxID=2528593 RepID=UPI001D1201D2|nr:twin-arginine translocase TatA/TatE family subunit [Zhaonella formicivorans]
MGFIPSIGFGELILILVLVLLIFGPGKLPEAGRALGKSMMEFRRAVEAPHTKVENHDNELFPARTVGND